MYLQNWDKEVDCSVSILEQTGSFEPSDLVEKKPLNGTSLIPYLWVGSKVLRVQHTLIFSGAIEVLMPERLKESRGLTVPGVGLLSGTFILCFILCMSAIPNSTALSASGAICSLALL